MPDTPALPRRPQAFLGASSARAASVPRFPVGAVRRGETCYFPMRTKRAASAMVGKVRGLSMVALSTL
jgi:hypothetical protein